MSRLDDLFPMEKIVDVTRETSFFSRPSGFRDPYVSKELDVLSIQIGPMKFYGYTSDRDFLANNKRFVGKIQIQHNSNWRTDLNMSQCSYVLVHFHFPEKDGKTEYLIAYIGSSTLEHLIA